MAYDLNRLSIATRDMIVAAKPIQLTFSESALLKLMLDRKAVKIKGGKSLTAKVSLNATNIGGVYTGFDVLDTDPQDPFQEADYDWAYYYEPITIAGKEEAENTSSEAIFNLVSELKTLALEAMRDQLAEDIYAANVANHIVGLREACDDATNTDTYAGISRGTYAQWKGRYYANGGVGRAVTYKLLNRCLAGTLFRGKTANTGVTTVSILSKLKELIQGQQRYTDSTLAGLGFESIMFEGKDIIADEYCTAQNFYWLSIDPEVLNITINSNRNFYVRPFIQPVNQDAATSMIFLTCQLVCKMPKRNARIISLDADL